MECTWGRARRRAAVVGLLVGGLVFGAFGGSSVASAAQTTRTWVGGGAGNDWSTAGNWSSGDVPDATDEAALFTDDPVGQTKLTPNLSANTTIGQLQFSAAAPSYTLTGNGTILSLSPGANYGGVGLVASGVGNQTIATTQVFLFSTQTWDIDGSASVTATGTIEDDSVIDSGLTKNGTGTLVLPGDVRYDGPTTVNAGLLGLSFSNTSMLSAFTVNGGVLRATTSGNALGNSSTRNPITLAGGALELANNAGQLFGSSSRITTVSGNATIRSDRLAAGGGVNHSLGPLRIGGQTLSVAPGSLVTSGTAGMTFGATTLSGNPTFDVVTGGNASAQLTLGAVGQSGGTRSVSKTGDGTLRLNGAGSYTGSTTLTQGAITLGVANALGSGGFNFAGGTLNANNTTDASIGAMALTADSTLNLSPGGAAAPLTFAGVSGPANGVLTITGWSGAAGGSGTDDTIIFSGGTAPDAAFLQHIRFDLGGGTFAPGVLGAGGELHPAGLATVPSVVNLTQAAATTAIDDAGLVVGTVATAASATVAVGSVISQSPSAGASVAPGSAVNLVVSTGATVPDVVGQTEAAATDALTSAGFVVTMSTQASTDVPSGSVISQTPAGGTSASGGSTVALVISSGAPPAPGSVFGDFDGDGSTDFAVWRSATGRWFIEGTAGSTSWGNGGDLPVVGDFDGDGTADIAVFRPSNGRWYVEGIVGSTQWGVTGDVPVPGDYDGDGSTDFAVYRPSTGRWYVNGIAGSTQWGKSGDVPAPGDYDGDGATDIAVFRPSNGRWYVEGIVGSTQWGVTGDVPVPGDYDGDGSTDFAVYRPSTGRWYVNGTAGSTQWGKSGDVPVPGDYDGDGATDIAVFRPANGRWYVEGIAGNIQWGVGNQDTPVTAPLHMIPGLLGI